MMSPLLVSLAHMIYALPIINHDITLGVYLATVRIIKSMSEDLSEAYHMLVQTDVRTWKSNNTKADHRLVDLYGAPRDTHQRQTPPSYNIKTKAVHLVYMRVGCPPVWVPAAWLWLVSRRRLASTAKAT